MIEDEGELVLVASIPPLVVISLLAVFGYGLAAVVLSIGWFVGVAPLLVVYGDRLLEEDEEATADPQEALREQYARGEITHDEFERQVEQVLEAEDVDPAEAERVPETEREPE